ncbi:hypothetical protein [uncultured Sulfuricurvum sp.]|uniref:hypothetical protein n=1 Tax=uncultured Sulfuricurvum sp. TaxID=430693 RepID=UPI002633E85F|nr:hypothetical protein [uncultured Sulfuricurvum sp.]
MPLSNQTFESFYMGNAAENKIMSELFFLGYEAFKLNPDIGLDILVTNKAFSQFHKITQIQHYLQVKSTFLINGTATFSLTDDDLNFLSNGLDVTTVFCYIQPIIEATADSYSRGDYEPWRNALEAEGESIFYGSKDFKELKKTNCLSSLDFKGFQMGYIWFNSAQLLRAQEENIFSPWVSDKNVKMQSITIKLNEISNCITINDQSVIPEIRNIYYLLKESSTKKRLTNGDFLFNHY